jgi:hypothetical protein
MLKLNINHFLKIVLLLLFSSINYSIGLAQDSRLIAKNTFPSVVMLEMRDDKNRPISLGSGFFVRPDVVVTNYHVIEGASDGFAKIVGETFIYHIEGVVGIDKTKDLALLKLKRVNGKPLILADISKIEVGQEVFALGNPKGLEGTISPGIISGSSLRQVENENLIQITAPISPGSSGGPVVNRKGEVVGVAVASLKEGQSLNFAVPSSYLAILLANSKNVKSLSEVTLQYPEKKPSSLEPSFAETALWLTSKLEGTQYLTQAASSAIPSLVTLDSLRFSKCQMKVEVSYKTGNLFSVLTTKISLDLLSDATAELSKANTAGIWLSLERKVIQSLSGSTGENSTKQIDVLKIPVSDLQIGERGAKAFKQLAKLCKEELKSEPF